MNTQSNLIRDEKEHAILGVPGRLFALRVPPAPWVSGVFANQTWISESRKIDGYGKNARMYVEIRFDDNCRNGRMSCGITGEVWRIERGHRVCIAGGMLHNEIKEIFPELAPLLKWHGTATDGPMHYLANTVYLAGDRDCYGKRKGEPSRFDTRVYFGNSPVSHAIGEKFTKFIQSRMTTTGNDVYTLAPEHGEFRVIAIAHAERTGETYKYSPKYTFVGYGEKWHECPFDSQREADEWAQALNSTGCRFERVPVAFSDGKERELDAARRVAVWPDATDEQLCSEPEKLRELLNARLPSLMVEFRRDMESIGFLWKAPERV